MNYQNTIQIYQLSINFFTMQMYVGASVDLPLSSFLGPPLNNTFLLRSNPLDLKSNSPNLYEYCILIIYT